MEPPADPDRDDFWRSTHKTIAEGVRLILVIRDGERKLEELSKEFHGSGYTHNIHFILQEAKVGKLKESLDAIVATLAALSHTPVEIVPDMSAFRAWMAAHREQLDAFKTYCDEHRPASPLEEGEVHPDVDSLLSAVQMLEWRIDELERVVNPEAFELQRRAARLHEAHRRDSQLFSDFIAKFDFLELSAECQQFVVEERVVRVARETFDGMVQGRDKVAEREAFFWLQPVQEGDEIDSMDIDEI
ncbi:hypothetical protein C8R44DRAFT_802385 [Mycena epipterygia]|nr:hypothetical protein C8R44DRAFT_802385 [Mycena epipterygia]